MKENNTNLLDKINDIADKKENEVNKKNDEYIDTILNTYNNLEKHFERFDKDIEVLEVGVNRKVLNFSNGLYESDMYKKFSANCITHGTGFAMLDNNHFGLGKFGGGCCGEIGILYKNGKLYLTTSNWHNELLLELNNETTKNDILNNKQVVNNLKGFAEYCEVFERNIIEKLNEFENYVNAIN